MIHHNKTYENVFAKDNGTNTIKLESITTDIGGVVEYIKFFQSFMKEFYDDLFLQCVKLSWLRRKFKYKNQVAKMPIYASSRAFHGKFTKFLRRYIGHDIQIITKGYFFNKLETYYFDTLFPGFMEGNPFENPDYYRFPYKNISMEYLTLVYQLDDRFELIKEADKNKMSYESFLDYVLNHISSENQILGRDRYILSSGTAQNRTRPYFFVDNDKIFKSIKGSKRI